ncbi:putative ribonuclease H-like domain-containing protein [Tanacetum coccineum]
MDNTIAVSPIPTLRIHRIYQQGTNSRDTTSAFKQGEDSKGFFSTTSLEEPKTISQALQDESWVEAMQEELLQFKLQKVWVLVDLPYRKKIGGRYRLYEVFAPVAKNWALGFVDPAHPNKVYKVIKALYGLHQAPRAWYETLSSFLMENGFRRVKQQPDGIFISQDKYVADILKKFDFLSIRTATTPIESNKLMVKDEDGVDVDVHVYRSMIGSLMYLTALRLIIRLLLVPVLDFKDSPFELEAYSDSDYGGASLDRKSTIEYVTAANYCGQDLLPTKGFDVTRISMDLRMDRSCAANSTHIWSVVDFLKGTSLGYALTHNPTIYDSLVKQFWQTTTVRTLANGTQQLVASIDSKKYTITEASVKSKLQLADATGIHNLSDVDIYAGLATLSNTSGSAEDSVQLKELMVLVPKLVNRIGSLEKELKETKQTLGNAVLTLVKKVKTLEVDLKRKSKKVIVSDSEGEEPEDQGRIIQDIDDDPLDSLVRESMKEKLADFVTPTKASGEGVSKAKSTDKVKRYRRRARSMAKNINVGLDVEDEINTGRVENNTGIDEINTGSTKVDTDRTSISTSSIILSPKKGQREGKAQMVEEDIQDTHKTKEQIRQEEAGLEEAIRLQAQMDEEVAKQIHLDKMVAKRVQEEQELSEQQLKRKAEVQEAAQFYTEEDWDTIRAKLEANTEVVKSLQGESISNDDFAKRMVEMINEKKKFYAEQKAKAKRSKPMTQAQQREYMSTFIKNQSSWKLSQLKKLSFEELKTEFEKLMKSIESFVPMETEARVKRHGLQLEQETSKKQKIDIEDASITKGKDEVVKEEEAEVPVKKTGKRRKQKARKGINIAKTAQDEFNNEREAFVKDKVKDASSESEIGVDAIPTATKPPTIVNWKIISQSSQKAAYQIIRRDGSDKIYMSFGAILKDFSRDDLIELYRLVIKKYGANRPEEMYDRVLWGDLKTMFDPPLSDDAIWSLPLQQKIINWRYYPTCAVHCLTLDASTIYMLADRKYPLSKDACQVMLKMKLLDGTMDEVCYQLLKMIEKQAGIRK